MSLTLQDIKCAVRDAIAAQDRATAQWHRDHGAERAAEHCTDTLESCIICQHACNFLLWHIEDVARRHDVGTDVIADCKHRIDGLNQRRNDGMERVDGMLFRMLQPVLPSAAPNAVPHYNTESLGMAIDRLSILSLKIWHMDEQVGRSDVDARHIRNCAEKAAILREQRADLERSVLDLLDEFAAGYKQPRLYFQFKMYNDPALNPELYGNRRNGGESHA